MNDKQLDERIEDLVRKVAVSIPDGLEDRALAKSQAEARKGARPERRRRPAASRLWSALGPAAVLAGLAVLIALPPMKAPDAGGRRSAISEIRTEFELADKNIKIVFFQKPDFNLFKETNHE